MAVIISSCDASWDRRPPTTDESPASLFPSFILKKIINQDQWQQFVKQQFVKLQFVLELFRYGMELNAKW